jgi:hypothetical protein
MNEQILDGFQILMNEQILDGFQILFIAKQWSSDMKMECIQIYRSYPFTCILGLMDWYPRLDGLV